MYCDLNNRCFACGYLSNPANLCDTFDGRGGCCSAEFGAKCTSDPKRCVSSGPSYANMRGVTWDSLASANAPAQDADKYRTTDFLVIRRGRTFKVSTSSNPYTAGSTLTFAMKGLDRSGRPIGNDLATFVMGGSTGYWCKNASSVDGGATTWELGYAANGYLGPMQLSLNLCTAGGRSCQTSVADFFVFVVADPSASTDHAYMSDPTELQEYCGAEYGSMWLGSVDNMRVQRWTFDQFSSNSVKVAAILMGALAPADRNSLVKVSRHMSGLVNANSMDGGVIVGKWENKSNTDPNPYWDGTDPKDWQGSDEIYRDFLNKGVVKYGQCWVFAGVLTTVMRTYGICSRPITNYVSPHPDAPYTGSIKMYYTARGVYERTEGGSVWNFHAWTDSYFHVRDDGQAAGWQAIDATPQELSEGKMQLGPASLKAIASKSLGAAYDVTFVVGEVSSAIERWGAVGGSYQLFESDSAGRMISTQQPGSVGKRFDITGQYKNKVERMERSRVEPTTSQKYLNTEITINGKIIMGKDIPVHLKLELVDKKKGKDGSAVDSLPVDVVLWLRFTDYTNRKVNREVKYDLSAVLKGANLKAEELDFSIPAADYVKDVKAGYQFFELQAVCNINGKQKDLVVEALPASLSSSMTMPEIKVTLLKLNTTRVGSNALQLGEELVWLVTFTNPLNVPMTELLLTTTLSDDAPDSLIPPLKLKGQLDPGQTLEIAQTYTPERAGMLRLIVRLNSAELPQLTGDAFLDVIDRGEIPKRA
eukprot:gb/GEZN01001716.1/.p1 GENE.gb/GEZN01001716.1/~~gb/GEZN01001716.1/.p1  ORF type:complete len:865 (+),score=107.75 gb/GEZN01001716.1/:316-2595(+)